MSRNVGGSLAVIVNSQCQCRLTDFMLSGKAGTLLFKLVMGSFGSLLLIKFSVRSW